MLFQHDQPIRQLVIVLRRRSVISFSFGAQRDPNDNRQKYNDDQKSNG